MSKLNQWLTLIANVSVVIGIVFVAVEMRQNTDAIRAQTRDSMTEKQMLTSEWIATTPELAEVWALAVRSSEGTQALDPERRPMLEFWLQGVFRSWENEHYQYLQGLYSPEDFQPRLDRWRRSLGATLYQQYWERSREVFAPSFRAEIDRIVAEVEQAQ